MYIYLYLLGVIIDLIPSYNFSELDGQEGEVRG